MSASCSSELCSGDAVGHEVVRAQHGRVVDGLLADGLDAVTASQKTSLVASTSSSASSRTLSHPGHPGAARRVLPHRGATELGAHRGGELAMGHRTVRAAASRTRSQTSGGTVSRLVLRLTIAQTAPRAARALLARVRHGRRPRRRSAAGSRRRRRRGGSRRGSRALRTRLIRREHVEPQQQPGKVVDEPTAGRRIVDPRPAHSSRRSAPNRPSPRCAAGSSRPAPSASEKTRPGRTSRGCAVRTGRSSSSQAAIGFRLPCVRWYGAGSRNVVTRAAAYSSRTAVMPKRRAAAAATAVRLASSMLA